MKLVRLLFGRPAILLSVVAFVIVAIVGIGYTWWVHSEESRENTQTALPSLVPPVAPSPVPRAIEQSASALTPQAKPKSPSVASARPTIPMPGSRPKFWQVRPDEKLLGYQEGKLVWCAEEYIVEGSCTLPLYDMLGGGKQRKVTLNPEEFAITSFGITHVPTETRFIAYLGAQRFGFFWDGKFGVSLPNGKKYDGEEVRQAMKEHWRKRMDLLDPNGPVDPE